MMNWFKSGLLIFSILAIFTACGTTKKANPNAVGASKTDVPQNKIDWDALAAKEKALLWSIEKSGYKTSYLYGTIHMIPAADFYYPTGTKAAIDASSKMIFEIDMNQMTDMGVQMKMMQRALMKDGKKLKDLLTDEEYAMVAKRFKELGLPLAMFERMKPAFLTMFTSEDMSPTAMKSGKTKSYEMEFLEIAKEKKMEMGGLETIEYQMSVFDSIPYKDQAVMLIDAIRSSEEGKDQFKTMVKLYRDQDLQGMSAMFTEESIGDRDILLDNRNRNWIPVMMKEMETQPCFFAVGAGHLVDGQGVVALLRAKGFTVKPISNKK